MIPLTFISQFIPRQIMSSTAWSRVAAVKTSICTMRLARFICTACKTPLYSYMHWVLRGNVACARTGAVARGGQAPSVALLRRLTTGGTLS